MVQKRQRFQGQPCEARISADDASLGGRNGGKS